MKREWDLNRPLIWQFSTGEKFSPQNSKRKEHSQRERERRKKKKEEKEKRGGKIEKDSFKPFSFPSNRLHSKKRTCFFHFISRK